MNDLVPETSDAVVGMMATFPRRFAIIRDVIATIAPQLDRLYVYVNETTDGFPDMTEFDNVVVLNGREHAGDLSANGKIYPLKYVRNCTVFTLDDDFRFPPDYVSKFREILAACENRCCVACHASILPPDPDWYFERTKTYISTAAQRGIGLATLAGSGTFAFHQSTLQVTPQDFMPDVMVDLLISLHAHAAGLPIFVVARETGWLENFQRTGMWEQLASGSLTHHTARARTHDWSFDNYAPLARAAIDIAVNDTGRLSLSDFDPALINALETGVPSGDWSLSRRTLERRGEYLQIIAPGNGT